MEFKESKFAHISKNMRSITKLVYFLVFECFIIRLQIWSEICNDKKEIIGN